MKNTNVEKWEKERLKHFARLTMASTKFGANEIAPRLKKTVLDSCGNITSVSNTFVVMRDGYNNEVLHPVITIDNGNSYVDGSVCYSQKCIERYLSKNDFVVEWTDDGYLRYGIDSVPVRKLTVSYKVI